jgi:hypothetical protein
MADGAFDGTFRFAFAEAESAERLECLGADNSRARRDAHGPVLRTVTVLKTQLTVRLPRNGECAAMHGTMVRSTKGYEILELVTPTIGPMLDVVHVHEHCMATTRDYAAPSVASENMTAHGRRYRLCSARPITHVGRLLHR